MSELHRKEEGKIETTEEQSGLHESKNEDEKISQEKREQKIESNKPRKSQESEEEALRRRAERSKQNVYLRAIKKLFSQSKVWTRNEMDAALFLVRSLYSIFMGIVFGYMKTRTAVSWIVFTIGFIAIPLYIFPSFLHINLLKMYQTKSKVVTQDLFKIYGIFCLVFIIIKIRILLSE